MLSHAVTTITTTDISSDNGSLSVELVAGMSAVVAFFVALVIGFLFGISTIFLLNCIKKSVHLQAKANPQPTAPADADYEQISSVIREEIELKSNQAYGPIER